MARATFLSDVKLIVDTPFRLLDTAVTLRMLEEETIHTETRSQRLGEPASMFLINRVATVAADQSLDSGD